jgi:RNase P/RNase MRP subunit POP5
LLKKIKHRYVALTIDSPGTFSSNEFVDAVWNSILRLYGEHGASTVKLSLISFDGETKSAVLRVGHKSLGLIRTALASVTKIEDKPAAVHVSLVSGTLKALHKKMASAPFTRGM